MSFVEELKFSDLTKLLEAVSTNKSIKKRDEFMQDYFKKLLKFQKEFKAKNPNKDSSLLPVLRLILAQEERERTYFLQEKSLRQLYIKTLNISSVSADGMKILQCCEEELPSKIGEVMKTRTSEGSLSIYDADAALQYLGDNQKMSLQENQLRRVILGSNAVDQKWFSKMILKRMNLNMGTAKILKLFHRDANELFMKYNHLSRVVEIVESGKSAEVLMEATKVFDPIKSMLCQKFLSSSNKLIQQKELYQETKMDGERFQLHMKDNKFRYFSRNGHEYSDGFNAVLTPLIKFLPVVHSLILDGEMLVFDTIERRYHTKGETSGVDVKFMNQISSTLRPCFCAFDILHYNDNNYMNRPYHERTQLLSQLFTDREGVLVKTEPSKIRDSDHLVNLINAAIANEEEGIVLKDAESIYKPGDRAGGWYKVKPDYFDGDCVKEFDCVIIGGYFANRFKRNYIQTYMLGAVEKVEDGTFNVYAIGEVVHGVTKQERLRIHEHLEPHFIDHNLESVVSFPSGKIYFGGNKPHVWIHPNKSIVLECRASELSKSSEQYTPYTFRFPRITSIRRDKIWEESCTLEEFKEMCRSGDGRVQKVVMRTVKRSDLESPSRNKKVATSKAGIIAQFCHNSQELEDIEALDNVLEGKEFCVLTTSPKLPSTAEMKMIIKRHGGVNTEFPRKGKTFAIIVGEFTNLAKSFMNEKVYNVIKADWLIKHFPNESLKEMPKIRPGVDLIFATEGLKESFKDVYDEYGDSYTEELESVEDLKALMDTMDSAEVEECELMELDNDLEEFGLPNLNIFRCVNAVFCSLASDNHMLNSSKSIFKLRAGKVVDTKDFKGDNELVIVDKSEKISSIKEKLLKSQEIQSMIDYQWILKSFDAKKLLDKESFLVRSAK